MSLLWTIYGEERACSPYAHQTVAAKHPARKAPVQGTLTTLVLRPASDVAQALGRPTVLHVAARSKTNSGLGIELRSHGQGGGSLNIHVDHGVHEHVLFAKAVD